MGIRGSQCLVLCMNSHDNAHAKPGPAIVPTFRVIDVEHLIQPLDGKRVFKIGQLLLSINMSYQEQYFISRRQYGEPPPLPKKRIEASNNSN